MPSLDNDAREPRRVHHTISSLDSFENGMLCRDCMYRLHVYGVLFAVLFVSVVRCSGGFDCGWARGVHFVTDGWVLTLH